MIERLRLLLDGHTTGSGRRVQVEPFESARSYDSVFLDVNRPGAEAPASIDCIGVFDRHAPSTEEFPRRPARLIRVRDKRGLLDAVGVVSRDRPNVFLLFVYGTMILMAIGLLAVIAYGLIKGL